VALKLHEGYGFSYDHLKVLLGGWHGWQQAGYPVTQGAADAAIPAEGTPLPGP
jgi:3-mercaptopyruvate sulfurtransferase SseA